MCESAEGRVCDACAALPIFRTFLRLIIYILLELKAEIWRNWSSSQKLTIGRSIVECVPIFMCHIQEEKLGQIRNRGAGPLDVIMHSNCTKYQLPTVEDFEEIR